MLATLPIEIIQEIFLNLDDLGTLKEAALCCRTLYEAFLAIEELLTTTILHRQIHPSVLPDAINTHVSFSIPSSDTEAVNRFSTDYLNTKKILPSKWKLANALPLSLFHQFVDYFATRLSSMGLEDSPSYLREPPCQANPTESEILRIQRALYRFQLYRNMFGTLITDPGRQRELMFRYFSTFENEQLASVNDLLLCAIAEPYNDLVDHDIHWGSMRVSYLEPYDSEQGDYILSKGLEYLFHLTQTKSYTERRRLLSLDDFNFGYDDEPGRLVQFMKWSLSWAGSPDWDYQDFSFDNLDEESMAFHIGKPFYDDGDEGPVTAWKLGDYLVADPSLMRWRRWGYVFWDMSRLENSGIIEKGLSEDSGFRRLRTTEAENRRLFESQEEREKIERAGGSGWWSFKDQSKVQWKCQQGRTKVQMPWGGVQGSSGSRGHF
ncbi:uncharacterized protein F4822DRAFT_430910 [Hypoxylon trugodes]|uniref:uncharacterized protein n=1 Tax=Hypoxylon trugodes TaxID=326681 RepID=UPI00219D5F00|nr:uncharacterized protein F4822DRAFT_430910 [Hypoxylon trugodes]KAI1388155.1 hypothetical protein F4822DRAFT_430910 [Hypoxylon trugodes]